MSGILSIRFIDGGALFSKLVNPSGLTTIEGEFMLLEVITGNIPLITKKVRKKIIIDACITRKLDKLLPEIE